MKILVANLGSTSFKYRLFDMAAGEKVLARGGVERIGSAESKAFVEAFQAKYNRLPENHAWISYVTLKIMAQAMAEAGSAETPALIEYLESGAEFDILKDRPAYFRPWDHQLIQEAYPFTVKPEGEAADEYDMIVLGDAVPAASEPLEGIYPTAEQNACTF